GAGIDGVRGVGKQTHLGIRPHLETGDVRANVTDRIEARPTRIEHVEQIPLYGQTGWKQAARRYAVHERQEAILGYAERGNRALMTVTNVCAIKRVLLEAFGIDREETTMVLIQYQTTLGTERVRRVQLYSAAPSSRCDRLHQRQRPVVGPMVDLDFVVS